MERCGTERKQSEAEANKSTRSQKVQISLIFRYDFLDKFRKLIRTNHCRPLFMLISTQPMKSLPIAREVIERTQAHRRWVLGGGIISKLFCSSTGAIEPLQGVCVRTYRRAGFTLLSSRVCRLNMHVNTPNANSQNFGVCLSANHHPLQDHRNGPAE